MRLGCIGIGSNAIRLLVASWKDGQLCDVRRERRGTRLFAGLIGGRLTEESIQSSGAVRPRRRRAGDFCFCHQRGARRGERAGFHQPM